MQNPSNVASRRNTKAKRKGTPASAPDKGAWVKPPPRVHDDDRNYLRFVAARTFQD